MWPGANASPCETMEHGPPDFLRREGLRALERLRFALPVHDEDRGLPAGNLRDVVRDDEVEADLLHEAHGAGLQIGRAHPRLRLESDEDLRALPESGQNLGRRGEFEGDCPLARWDLALRLFRREVADCSG